ncbi:MAG: tetratricopeptide repeat protein [Acidobacteriota bacterium]
MFRRLTRVLALAVLAAALAMPAAAQTGMVKGKVVDGEGKPMPNIVVTIEYLDGVTRKMETKTDRRGEFIQIGLASGNYSVTATDPKLGSQAFNVRVRLGATSEVNFVLKPGETKLDTEKLKAVFAEGVTASQNKNFDVAIAKFTEASGLIPNCYDCFYNIGYAYLQKQDEKQAEAAWKQALEAKPDHVETLNALATLYNNQKRFDEAAAMSQRAATAGPPGALGGNADAIYNQGIILWNQGKIPDAKAKFEEAIAANPSHAEAHYQLGMALVNEGKLPEAVKEFETYLSLAPSGQFAATAKSLVEQLKK